MAGVLLHIYKRKFNLLQVIFSNLLIIIVYLRINPNSYVHKELFIISH